MRRMLGNISELVSARLVRGIGESAHRDRALFRFGWLDAYRRAIHRCILGLDESHSILSARLPLTLPIRSLSLNRFKPGIHCSSATRLPNSFPLPSFLRSVKFNEINFPVSLDFIASLLAYDPCSSTFVRRHIRARTDESKKAARTDLRRDVPVFGRAIPAA